LDKLAAAVARQGIPAANTSLLAKFFVGKVLLSTIKGEIVHVNGSDLT
jgi:hypothetical protein